MDSNRSLSTAEIVRKCTACGDSEAWKEFVRRFHRLIATVVLRTARRLGDCSPQTIDDLIQDTYLKLCDEDCRVLRRFEERSPEAFLGYLKVVASNVARDHFKAVHSQKRGPTQVDSTMEAEMVPTEDRDSGSAHAMEREVMIREIENHLLLCASGTDQERARKVFWLYYRAGFSASAIASLPGIDLTTKGVESLILRTTRELRHRMIAPDRREKEFEGRSLEGTLPAQSL